MITINQALLAALKGLVSEIRAYSSPECDDGGSPGAAELKAADAAIAIAESELAEPFNAFAFEIAIHTTRDRTASRVRDEFAEFCNCIRNGDGDYPELEVSDIYPAVANAEVEEV